MYHGNKISKERYDVTDDVLYDKLLKEERQTPRGAASGAGNPGGNGVIGSQRPPRESSSNQLDRRKRFLSWGDEDPGVRGGGKISPSISTPCDSRATIDQEKKWQYLCGRLLPTNSSTVFLEPIRPPLDFLGLMACKACEFRNLPAKKVAGHFSVNSSHQVLNAVQIYQDKVDLLVKGLQYLFQIFRYEICDDVPAALNSILCAMENHHRDNRIQISASASLFYVVKNDLHQIGSRVKRRIIRALVSGMETHNDERTMLRNACLTISHFDIPKDMLFCYERVVAVLLTVVRAEQPDDFVQRIGIFLLNSLACQVEGDHKLVVGLKGGIDSMLDIIRFKLDKDEPVCDEVMEIAWSTMWNVTDETADNCARFLERGGMKLFVRCLETFPEKPELLRNMLGLLGNVAEVQHLRPQLMNSRFLSIFSDLLDSTSDGIEVSYNAAGVLSHIASDGDVAWSIEDPENAKRTNVLARMVSAIERWELKIGRNINYRSFEPILRLVQVFDTPQVQHWAVWALANLTSVYSDKYCKLVRAEKGDLLLQELLQDPRPYARVRELAQVVLDNVAEQIAKEKERREAGEEEMDMDENDDSDDD